MPNHCWNEVTVHRLRGDKGANVMIAENIVDKGGDEGLQFSFNVSVPQPPDLYQGGVGADSPSHNWYTWNTQNWGTKWDAYETMPSLGGGSRDIDTICFNTAWGPPHEFFLKWSEKYPDFAIDVISDIEGESEMLHTTYQNGSYLELDNIPRLCEECGIPEEFHTNEDGEYVEDCSEVYTPGRTNADKPVEACPNNNDITDDCKNCILGGKCHWDGKACVDR